MIGSAAVDSEAKNKSVSSLLHHPSHPQRNNVLSLFAGEPSFLPVVKQPASWSEVRASSAESSWASTRRNSPESNLTWHGISDEGAVDTPNISLDSTSSSAPETNTTNFVGILESQDDRWSLLGRAATYPSQTESKTIHSLFPTSLPKINNTLHSSLLLQRDSHCISGVEWSADTLFGLQSICPPLLLQSNSSDFRTMKSSISRTPSTKTCHFFVQGHCARGAQCKYGHFMGEVEQKTRTKSDPSMQLNSGGNGFIGAKLNRRGSQHDAQFFVNCSIQDFKGQIFSLCKDQQGCRFLQKRLDDGDDASLIFNEIYPHFIELMADPFGNYLCQKLLDFCSPQQKYVVVGAIAGALVGVCLNAHGTRAVQKLCEIVADTDLVYLMIDALRNNVVTLIKDLNGNHVVQKCLQFFKPHHNQFIYDAITMGCVEVATHRHGCCVIQRCIDRASATQKLQLVNEIAAHSIILVQNAFGNYVVQYILELNELAITRLLIERFLGNIWLLSAQKFSSNVMEKCLRVADKPTRDVIIAEIMVIGRLEAMLRDPYANYVVQTALDVANPVQKETMIHRILPVMPFVRATPHGKRLQTKLNAEDTLLFAPSPVYMRSSLPHQLGSALEHLFL